MNEPIAQGGTNVSGGQKQRLSIARALAKDAQVYIFDDTFSALDYATDAKLRAALAELITKKHATVFIVAQRISSIMHADKIIVLDQGKMAGIGTHEELLKSCEGNATTKLVQGLIANTVGQVPSISMVLNTHYFYYFVYTYSLAFFLTFKHG